MPDSSSIVLSAPDGARAEVFRHGAHVTSWIPAGEAERLFLSERSAFDAGSAIRGGVPVIFPQFANRGPLPKHGFARTMEWRVVEHAGSRARLHLSSNAETLAIWPYAFVAEVGVHIGGESIEIELAVHNMGTDPFAFTGALHTYLAVGDVERTVVRGLGAHELRINGEHDQIYRSVLQPLTVDDGEHVTEVSMRGFRDVVVWNPGVQKAAALADMAPGAYRRMLCVEAAAIENPIVLAAGEQWSGTQELSSRA
jgi:glucose-6-phosphate 1-epimerase